MKKYKYLLCWQKQKQLTLKTTVYDCNNSRNETPQIS